jgi:CRP-like cAMP-binding protein
MVEYVSCIISGRVCISRLDADYAKAHVARLGAGEWFGVTHLFSRSPSREEIFADGEVVLWTISPDTLRNIFFEAAEGVQLLYNIAAHLALMRRL